MQTKNIQKVILITGASKGIGLACAQRLISEGASVMLVDIKPEGAAAAAALGEFDAALLRHAEVGAFAHHLCPQLGAGDAVERAEQLDIGAGGGEFCFMAQQQGFEVQGIEPNHGYSEFAREQYGIEVITAGMADVPAQSADVVTMFHVLEHLAHPQQVAEKIWHILRPGGLWVIEVPNILQTDASPHNIYFKAHLFYYSRHSLGAATSRFFDVGHLHDDGNLFAVLARRSEPLNQMLLPTAEDLQHARRQLAAKGWWQYLTVGGGWRKPAQRVRRLLQERQIPEVRARELLQNLHDTREAYSPRP